jgi:hypothetical protein
MFAEICRKNLFGKEFDDNRRGFSWHASFVAAALGALEPTFFR